MLTKRYMVSVKNLPDIMSQIVRGTAPTNFNVDHLKSIGFASSSDRAIVPLLKDLGFLSESGSPTKRYHDYRAGGAKGKAVLGEALLEAYEDLFHIDANPTEKDREAIVGKFKSAHNVGDRAAEQMAITFFALAKLADIKAAREGAASVPVSPGIKTATDGEELSAAPAASTEGVAKAALSIGLRYNIEVHLPATKDIEVFHAIFKALKEHFYE